MQVFSIGNLITFFAVLLILVIFRALDRNNRSLEKLKRFSDKISENISAFVEERTGELRALALQLQGSLTAGREMIARVGDAEEALQARAADLEGIRKRLSDFERGLSELATQSARVDSTMKKLREESELVDSMGRRIGESMARLDKTEKRLPEIESGMAARAQKVMESARAELIGVVEKKVGSLISNVEESEKRLKGFSTYITRLEAREAQAEKERAAYLSRSLEAFQADLNGKLSQAAKRGETLEDEVFARLADSIRANEAAFAKTVEGFELRIADYKGDVDYKIKALEGSGGDVEAMRASLRESIEKTAAAVRLEMNGVAAELVEGWQAEVGAASNAREQLHAGLAEVQAGLEELKTRAYQDVEKRLSVFEDEFFADLRQRSGAMMEKYQAWQNGLEERVGGFERDVTSRLSSSAESVEGLRETLRAEIEKARKDSALSVEKEIAGVRDSLDAGTRKVHREVETRLKDLSAELETGRRELAELLDTSRTEVVAWEARARQQLAETEVAMAEKISRLSAAAESSIESVHETFDAQKEELLVALNQERVSLKGELKGVSDRIGTFEEEMKRSSGAAAESFRAQMERAGKETVQAFEKELAGLKDALETGAEKMHQQIEGGLAELAIELEKGRAELAAQAASSIGSIQNNFASQSEDLVKRTSEERAALKKELAGLESALETGAQTMHEQIQGGLAELAVELEKGRTELAAEAASSVESIRDGFATQSEDLVKRSSEERAALKKELADIGGRVGELQAELAKTTEATTAGIRGQIETFQLDIQKRMRDLQADVDVRIKEYRQLLAESREKAEAQHEKLFGKIDESYRTLSGNLVEVDKRVKNFMSQTRLFERADTLKAALEATIDEMKKEITRLGVEKAELTEIELSLTKTRKVADEVTAKLSRFLSEKRRIDEMEGAFKKVLTLSRDIDLKVDTLSGSNDALQQIQAKIRQFEEMGKTVETGFDRLDKKQEILSITAEGVDRNFQRLENIEKILKETDEEASSLSARVQSLLNEYESLAERKKDAETAMEIAGKLTGVLSDLEQRMDKAQNAREWLARTETRFEEIGRHAQEQVRLLESIVKAETKKEKGDRGAPPMDKRETVVKLSHQGWSVQEISRVTQLSRGEVELILELAPKV